MTAPQGDASSSEPEVVAVALKFVPSLPAARLAAMMHIGVCAGALGGHCAHPCMEPHAPLKATLSMREKPPACKLPACRPCTTTPNGATSHHRPILTPAASCPPGHQPPPRRPRMAVQARFRSCTCSASAPTRPWCGRRQSRAWPRSCWCRRCSRRPLAVEVRARLHGMAWVFWGSGHACMHHLHAHVCRPAGGTGRAPPLGYHHHPPAQRNHQRTSGEQRARACLARIPAVAAPPRPPAASCPAPCRPPSCLIVPR